MKKFFSVLLVTSVAIVAVAATFGIQTADPSVWTIAGVSELCGSNWDPTDTSNDMTNKGNDVFPFVKENVKLYAGAKVEDITITPINVSEALALIENLEENAYSDKTYYVKGLVTGSVRLLSNGQAAFRMSDVENQSMTINVQVKSFDNENYEEGLIREGDTIVVYSYLHKYVFSGTTYFYLIPGYIVSVTNENSEAYNNLYMAIVRAKSSLKKQQYTSMGRELLTAALATAEETLNGNDDETMIAALDTLNEVIEKVTRTELLEFETIPLKTTSSHTYYGNEYITGEKARLLFDKGGTNNPYSDYSGLKFYHGNTLYIEALNSDYPIYNVTISGFKIDTNGNETEPYTLEWDDEPCLKITFENNYGAINVKSVTPELSRRSMSYGSESSTRNILLTSIVIAYDNPSAETLATRIAYQLQITDSALQNVVYKNVPGKAELTLLADSIRAVTTETDVLALKQMLRDLKVKTKEVVELDSKYQDIEATIVQVEAVIQGNAHTDEALLAQAKDDIAEMRQNMNDGVYTAEDIEALQRLLDKYIVSLSKVYLTINVERAGSMGDLILDQVENFADVYGLYVSGQLNSLDLETLKTRMAGMSFLDMTGVNMTILPALQFTNNTTLNKVVLPSCLQTIGYASFRGCKNLRFVTFPETLRQIGDNAFYGCRIDSLNFPEGLTSIGEYAFYNDQSNLTNLKEVRFPSTLSTIGNYAFCNQIYLHTVEMLNGITTIGSYAFNGCANLRTLLLPATLKTIGSSAFYGCTALTNLNIPEGVSTIGSNAFGGCTNLTEVNLPTTLQSLNNSFANCGNITKMTCKALIPPVVNNSSILGGSESKCTLTVPNLSIKVYKQTTYWDQFNIVGIDILPQNLSINQAYKINWPDSVFAYYHPSIRVEKTGKLTVNANSALSASGLTMVYDYDFETTYGSRTANSVAKCASLINNANTRSDVVTINFWMRANTWYFVSLPFDVRVSDIRRQSNDTRFVIRKYDSQKRAEGDMANTWVNVPADSILHAGQGYIWQSANRENYNYNDFWMTAINNVNKNRIFSKDDVEVTLGEYQAEFPQNRGWNLIGNPYPCYYDIRAIDMTSPITIWNEYYEGYEAYSPIDDQLVLRPSEAFFVQCPVGNIITFRKEGRQTDYTPRKISFSNSSRRMAMASAERSVFNLILSSGNDYSDRTRFVINNNAQMGYDATEDASKFMSSGATAAQLYTISGDVRYAINERPVGTGDVQLGMFIANEGTYTLRLDTTVENEVWLIDHLMGTETLLTAEEGYTFAAEAGTVDGRFTIRLHNGEVTGIKTVSNQQKDAEIYYRLDGVRVQQPTQGVYINNGKKVVVK